MSYNPGVADRSGEILGGAMAGGFGNLSQMLEQLSLHQEKKEEEEKMFGGLKKTFRPMWQEMGYGSQAEYDNADARTIAGAVHGQIQKQTISDYEQQRQLNAEKLTELAGGRAARGRFQGMVNAEPTSVGATAATGPGGNMGDAMWGLAQGSPTPASAAATGGGLSAERMLQMAVQSGLPAADTYHYMEAAANAAKAKAEGTGVSPIYDEDPVTGARMYRLGKQAIPTGMNPAMGGQLMQATDSETGEPIAGMFVDPRGRVVRRAAENAGRERKMGIDSLVEGEKALRGLDEDIAAWNSRAARAAKDKTVSAPDPAVLKSLQARRARIEGALSNAGTGPAEGAANGGADANAIRALFQTGKISREEARRRISALGATK